MAAGPAESALLDGEAVAFLPGGHSDFGALRTKAGGDDCGGWSLARRHTYWRQTGQEYLQASDKSAGDEAAVLEPLVRQFVREGYHSVPDWADLGEEAPRAVDQGAARGDIGRLRWRAGRPLVGFGWRRVLRGQGWLGGDQVGMFPT